MMVHAVSQSIQNEMDLYKSKIAMNRGRGGQEKRFDVMIFKSLPICEAVFRTG